MSHHILIVDDEPANRKLLKVLVEHEGFTVTEAGGGAEALSLLAERKFELVFLDMMMPEVDGRKVLQSLSDEGVIPGLPVVVVTANNDRKLRLEALALGAIDFASKPIDSVEMRCRLRNLIELGRLREEAAERAEAHLKARIEDAIDELPLVLYQSRAEDQSLGQCPVGNIEKLTSVEGTALFQDLWTDLVHAEDQEEIARTYQELQQGELADWHLQYRWAPINTGSFTWVSSTRKVEAWWGLCWISQRRSSLRLSSFRLKRWRP